MKRLLERCRGMQVLVQGYEFSLKRPRRSCCAVLHVSVFRSWSIVLGTPKNEPVTDQRSMSILITSSGIERPGLLPLVVVLMEGIGAWLLSV